MSENKKISKTRDQIIREYSTLKTPHALDSLPRENNMNKHRIIIYNYVGEKLKFEEKNAHSYEHAISLIDSITCHTALIYDKNNVLVATAGGETESKSLTKKTKGIIVVSPFSKKYSGRNYVPGTDNPEPSISNGKVVMACESNLGDIWCSVRYYIGRAIKESTTVSLSRIVVKNDTTLPIKDRRVNISNLLERILAMYGDLANCITLVDEESPGHCNFAATYRSAPIQLIRPYRWHGQKSNYITYQLTGKSNPGQQTVPDDEQAILFDLAKRAGFETVAVGLPMTLEESVKTISGSRIFVGCDSAMAHIAHSIGIPTFVHRGKFNDFGGWIGQTQFNTPFRNRLMRMIDIASSPDWPCKIISDKVSKENKKNNKEHKENNMYGVATFNLDNYTELANITDATKMEYCQKHGYSFYALRDKKYSPVMGFNKIHFTLDLFKRFPDLEWLLFSECDAMITNQTIRIEDKIDNNFHFIVPLDATNINAGNFLARNTKEGRDYLQMIIDNELAYASACYAEQQVIIDTHKNYSDIVKIVPQRYMNSYEPELYIPYKFPDKDIAGNQATWEPGDWIMHWPGLGLPVRLDRARETVKRIVK